MMAREHGLTIDTAGFQRLMDNNANVLGRHRRKRKLLFSISIQTNAQILSDTMRIQVPRRFNR